MNSITFNKDININDNIVKLDDRIIDDEGRKNITNSLKSKIPKLSYRFNRGININKETLIITMIDIFKNIYKNVGLYNNIINEKDSWYLKEGCRYLSLEEAYHIIGLIHPENVTFYMDVDLK